MEVVLGMLFFTFGNVNIRFVEKKLVWRTYSAVKTLSTTQKVEIIDKKEFTTAILNEDNEIFVVHMVALSIVDSNIHPSWHTQITLLEIKKVIIPSKYANYTNIFSPDFVAELLKYTGINNHLTNLIDNKQPLYGLIYSLEPVELKILKTYIETNLINSFIRSSKSFAGAPIPFIRKKDGNLQLYVDY